jgi:hypothetical protein
MWNSRDIISVSIELIEVAHNKSCGEKQTFNVSSGWAPFKVGETRGKCHQKWAIKVDLLQEDAYKRH